MKKLLFLICALTFIFSVYFCVNALAADDISLVIDGQRITCDVPPVISNDRTLVPVRAVFEHLNAQVTWNGVLRQVVVTSDNKFMIFNIDSKIAYLNGDVYALDAAPVIKDGRTLVPIRFVSENLGYKVDWDGNTKTVYIDTVETELPPPEQIIPEEEENNSDSPKLSGVTVNETDTDYTIIVAVEENITPKVMNLSEPYRLIFDFYNVNQTCKDGNNKSYMSSIVETRWASHPEYTRVVVESMAQCVYTAKYSSGKYTIKITKPVISEEDPPEIIVPEITVPKDAPIVVLDAGHGGYDPGAVGRDSEGNIILYEKEISLKLAQKVRNLLMAKGVSVVMTRETDRALDDTEMKDLLARAEIANDSGASIFVSIHTNAFSNPEASGTCVLYAGLATNSGYDITGKTVAQNIQTPLVGVTGLRDRGVVARPNIVVLRETVMPAVLIECAFISCPTDQQILSNEVKLDQMAGAISDGIILSLKQMGKLK